MTSHDLEECCAELSLFWSIDPPIRGSQCVLDELVIDHGTLLSCGFIPKIVAQGDVRVLAQA